MTTPNHAKIGNRLLDTGKRQEAKIRAQGGPKGRLGSRSRAWYASQQRQLAGHWHLEAAKFLAAGDEQEYIRAAQLAYHHMPA